MTAQQSSFARRGSEPRALSRRARDAVNVSRARWRAAGNVVTTSVGMTNGRSRLSDAGSSFFGAGGNIIGTGLGLRQPRQASDAGDGAPVRVPAFWSPKTDAKAIWGLLTGSWLNVMLVLAPLGYIAHHQQWSATLVFCLVRSLASALPCESACAEAQER